jgi:hypothetical protein
MSEGTPIEELLEGVPALPNVEVKFENYAELDVKSVVIYGHRILDQAERKFKYRATLALLMNETNQQPLMLNFHLHEIFDDAEVMARTSVMWANMMFGHVSKMVSVFDLNTEDRIAHINVQQLVEIESAVEELKHIHRTDMRQIN